jgi:nucleotide-binding universal stress UspA family protein
MKTILVPTDFSKTAETAFDFAISLAKKLNSKLVLMNAYQVSAPIAEVPFGVLNDERRSLKEESEKVLKALKMKMDYAGNLAYECLSVEGDTSDSILTVAKEKKVDMIVMGTTGQTGLASVLFGSVSLRVMEKATCPVMAIPPGFSITNTIHNITYATNYHNSDLAAIVKATEIAAAMHAQLNIIHISNAVIGADEEKSLMRQFMEKVKKHTDYNDLSFQIIHGYNIEVRLEEYIEDGSTDMLLMATHYRDFLDKLFGRSMTKNIARSAIVPVVAFHFNAKTAVKLY